MVDWKRLGMAVLCTVATYGGCIVLVLLPISVLFALVIVAFVCMLIFLFKKLIYCNYVLEYTTVFIIGKSIGCNQYRVYRFLTR